MILHGCVVLRVPPRRNCFDLRGVWHLRPRESVEDGFRAVTRVGLQLAALGDEPKPVSARLKHTKAVIIGKAKDLNKIAWAKLAGDEKKHRALL